MLEPFDTLSSHTWVQNPPSVSFEFFPPKTPEGAESLWQTVLQLEALNPDFVSVTYGAGGSTREHTHRTVTRMVKETGLKPAAHLTCVGSSREEIDGIAQDYWEQGVRHIVALRGDPPQGGDGAYVPHPGGYAYASDLVEGLKQVANFEISVAAYPETHPDAVSEEKDLDYLKQKIDAGATRAITQFFFEDDVYLRFLERVEKAGISAPIVPGILLISNVAQMHRFAGQCGASVPKWMAELLEGADDHPRQRDLLTTMIASEQCRRLRAQGVDQFHFYTLNRADAVSAVCRTLGIVAKKG